MIIVMGHAQLGAGELDRLSNAMQLQLEATNAEDGCLHYSFARHVSDPDRLMISERWRDNDALAAHFETPHMAAFNAEIGSAQLLEISVKAYDLETGEVRQLLG